MASQQQQSGIAAFINSLGSDVQNNPVTQAIAKAIVGNKTPPTSTLPASQVAQAVGNSTPLPPIASQSAPSGNNTPTALPAISDPGEQDLNNIGSVITAPFQQISAYAKIQSNPQAKAQLAAINSNSKLSDDQKISQGNALMQQYGGQNATTSNHAMQGAETLAGMALSPDIGALNPSVGIGTDAAITGAKVGIQTGQEALGNAADAVGQFANETNANVAGNGGYQAGFIGMGKKAPEPPIDTTGMTDEQAARATPDNPTGANPVQLDSNALHDQYGLKSKKRVGEVQDTLDTVVGGSNPTEVYDNAQDTIENLGKQIDNIAGDNPSTASKADPNGVTYESMAQDMQAKARANGLMKTPEGAAAVNKAIAQQINHIAQNANAINTGSAATNFSTPIFNDDLTHYADTSGLENSPEFQNAQSYSPKAQRAAAKRMAGESIPNPVPDAAKQPLDMATLRNEYKAANADNSKLLQRRNTANAKPLSDAESAQLLYRDTLKDKIAATDDMRGKNDPKITPLISKQHDIYDAADILSKASTDYKKEQLAAAKEGASAAQPTKQGPIASYKQALKDHPLKTLGETATVLGGIGGIGYGISKTPLGEFTGAAMNSLTGNPSSMKGFKLNTNLPAHMNDQQAEKQTGLAYTADDYQKDINDPRYASNAGNFQVQTEAKWANAQKLANQNLTSGAKTFMSGDAQTALSNQASLNKVNLQGLSSVLQRLKTTQAYDSYTSNPNNPYAKELGTLQQANSTYAKAYFDITGQDPDPTKNVIQPGDTPEVVKEKLQTQNNFIMQTYQQYQPYWSIINATANTSQNKGIYNQNVGNTNGGSGNLPPISQGSAAKMGQLAPLIPL